MTIIIMAFPNRIYGPLEQTCKSIDGGLPGTLYSFFDITQTPTDNMTILTSVLKQARTFNMLL